MNFHGAKVWYAFNSTKTQKLASKNAKQRNIQQTLKI